MEENKETYETLSVSALKEKANSDSRACKELGERYLKDNQLQKAEELFNSAIEMVKENYEGTDTENNFLYDCYISLSDCYEEDSDEQLLNLLNATEITSDEEKKADAYDRVSKIYAHRDDDENFEKYFIKGNCNSKYGCLRIITYYQRHNNTVDNEEWLEKAKNMPVKDELGHFASDIIDFKVAVFNDTVKKEDCINLLSSSLCSVLNNEPGFYDYFLLDSEMRILIINISDSCEEKLKENDFQYNDFFLACYSLKKMFKMRTEEFISRINFSTVDQYLKNFALTHINDASMVLFENQCIQWMAEEKDKDTLKKIITAARLNKNEPMINVARDALIYVWLLENPDKATNVNIDSSTGKLIITDKERQRFETTMNIEENLHKSKNSVKKAFIYFFLVILALNFIGVIISELKIFALPVMVIVVIALYKAHKTGKLEEGIQEAKYQFSQMKKKQ